MDNTKPTKPYGGRIQCINGHLVGMKDDERYILKMKHHGREVSVKFGKRTSVEITCEKCQSRILVTLSPAEGTKRLKFKENYL